MARRSDGARGLFGHEHHIIGGGGQGLHFIGSFYRRGAETPHSVVEQTQCEVCRAADGICHLDANRLVVGLHGVVVRVSIDIFVDGWVPICLLQNTVIRVDHGLHFGFAHGAARQFVERRVQDAGSKKSIVERSVCR